MKLSPLTGINPQVSKRCIRILKFLNRNYKLDFFLFESNTRFLILFQ